MKTQKDQERKNGNIFFVCLYLLQNIVNYFTLSYKHNMLKYIINVTYVHILSISSSPFECKWKSQKRKGVCFSTSEGSAIYRFEKQGHFNQKV